MTDPPSFDPEAFKATARRQWEHAAQGWSDYGPMIRAWLAYATEAMLAAAAIGPGAQVLDVAAGAGDQTLTVAARVGPEGRVLATDLSPAILAHAQAHARRAGLSNVEFRVADGERLPSDHQAFDAAICRLGLMLFPDPVAGLAAMHGALRPGGRACTLVFSVPEANPCIVTAMRAAAEHAGVPLRDPFAPGMLFSLARPPVVDDAFARAQFRDVHTDVIGAPMHMPSAHEYVTFLRRSAGPIRDLLERLPPERADDACADIESRLRRFDTGTGWAGPNELLLTVGTRAD